MCVPSFSCGCIFYCSESEGMLISALKVVELCCLSPLGPMFALAAATAPSPAATPLPLPPLTSGRHSLPAAAAASTRLFLSRPRSASKPRFQQQVQHHHHHQQQQQQVGSLAHSLRKQKGWRSVACPARASCHEARTPTMLCTR